MGNYGIEIASDFGVKTDEFSPQTLPPSFVGYLVHNSSVPNIPFELPSYQGGVGIGAYSRNQIPWKDIADWTHRLPTTPTDYWMDVVDGYVRGPNHRWLRHNPIDFLSEYLKQGSDGFLSLKDYCKHISCDLITTKGIPLLPESAHNFLVSLGVPPQTIFEWTHMNLWDLSIGIISVGTGAYDVFLAISGYLPWGVKTMILTFGVGSAEIYAGIMHANPFLIAGGALKIGAGAISLWDYLTVPANQELPYILQGLLAGVGIGAIFSAVRIGLSWQSTSLSEKSKIAAENVGVGSLLGALSTISPILSIVPSLTLCAGKMAINFAELDNRFWDEHQLTSPLVKDLSAETIKKFGSKEDQKNFDKFLEKFQEKKKPLNKELQTWIEEPNMHLGALDSCKHVFENRNYGGLRSVKKREG